MALSRQVMPLVPSSDRGLAPITIRTCFLREAPPVYHVPDHIHHVAQCYLCQAGVLIVDVDHQPVILRSGEAVVLRPGVVRACRRGDPPPVYISAIFEDHALDVAAMHGRHLVLDEDLRQVAAALARELGGIGGPDSGQLCQALLVCLLIGLRRQATADHGPAASASDVHLVGQVERVMRRNLHRHLTRTQLAEALAISPVHLARLFKAAAGCTLHERLSALRLAQARLLLRDSTLPLERIAHEVGYRSASHFSRAFKQDAGQSPRAYRLEHGHER